MTHQRAEKMIDLIESILYTYRMDKDFERLSVQLAMWEAELTTRLGTRLSVAATLEEKFFQLGKLFDFRSDKLVARLEHIIEMLGAIDSPTMILVFPKKKPGSANSPAIEHALICSLEQLQLAL